MFYCEDSSVYIIEFINLHDYVCLNGEMFFAMDNEICKFALYQVCLGDIFFLCPTAISWSRHLHPNNSDLSRYKAFVKARL